MRFFGTLSQTVGIGLAVCGIGLAMGVPAQAAAPSGTSINPASTSTPKSQAHLREVYDVGCWTTFIPSNPLGGPMTQFYANCEHRRVTVCPAVTVPGHSQHKYFESAVTLGPYTGLADDSDTAIWDYGSTIPTGQYTTVFC
jgi:hypothetical protein